MKKIKKRNKNFSTEHEKPKMHLEYEIEILRKRINKWNYCYHVLDKPIVSDLTYDKFFNKLLELEQQYPEFDSNLSPTKRIGGTVLDGFESFKHTTPVLSLDKAKNRLKEGTTALDDLCDWNNNLGHNIELTGEPKIDGLTVVLHYFNHQFIGGGTRGDGEQGDDVSNNLITIQNIPLYIKNEGHTKIRGEVYMSKQQLKNINDELEAAGELPYANCRNLAAGSLKQLDSSVTAARNLSFIAYDVMECEDQEFLTDEQMLYYLMQNGFNVIEYEVIKGFEQIKNYIDKMEASRACLAYDIDGLVFKVNDLVTRQKLGYSRTYPNFAIAYKFEEEKAKTIIIDIEDDISRTGRINPVAIVKPTKLCGTIVRRITLNNYDFIDEFKIDIGDEVEIIKAGEIIPQVVDNLTQYGPRKRPNFCPICNSSTRVDGAFLYCTNKYCPGKNMKQISHFVSKDAMNIEGLSENKIKDLMKAKLIKNSADLYKLNTSKAKRIITGLPKWGETSYNNLISAIEKSRKVSMEKFIYALGIPLIGLTSSKELCKAYNYNITSMKNCLIEDMYSIPDFGPATVENVRKYFHNSKNQSLIEDLLQYIEFNFQVEKIKVLSNKLQSKTFCITGELSLSRDNFIETYITSNGGEFIDGVKKGLQYMIVGNKPGSKLQKAKDKGVNIINEEEFMKMLK